jgi:hypothetical protein
MATDKQKNDFYNYFTSGIVSNVRHEVNDISQLPGRANGPADAYRHILLSAELTRTFGEGYARLILEAHEWTGNMDGQTTQAEFMDRHNNEIGIRIGLDLYGNQNSSWSDVVTAARQSIDATIVSGDPNGNTARWLSPDQWHKNPEITQGGPRYANDDPKIWPPSWQKLPDIVKQTEKNPFDIGPLDNLITEIQTKFCAAEQIKSPLVLDLNGDGVKTLSKSAGVNFDLDGNGFSETTGWAGKNDGLLVLDRNGNGKIDNGTELFGNNTILANGQKAANGFEALKEWDSNQNGEIDAADTAYTQLKIWKDANSDGISQADELLTLAQAGVARVALNYTNQSVTDAQGNQHLQTAVYTKLDGTTSAIDDVWFSVDNARTLDQTIVSVPKNIQSLPQLAGFGNVHDLQTALALDSSGQLQDFLNKYTALNKASDVASRASLMDTLIYTWAGVVDIDPTSRAATKIYGNVIGDARKLATLEAFMGEGFLGTWCWGTRDANPHGQAAPILLQAYDQLKTYMQVRLDAQTVYKPLYESVQYGMDWETGNIQVDASGMVAQLQALYKNDESSAVQTIQNLGKALPIHPAIKG